jgi:GNAT superfamily N-acetyltransferase
VGVAPLLAISSMEGPEMMSKLYVATTKFTGLRTTGAGTRVARQVMKGTGMKVQKKASVPVPFSRFEPEVRKGMASSANPGVRIRPLSPGDQDELREMLSRLSRETIHKRFHLPMPRVPEGMVAYLADVDHYDKEALVALVGDEIVGHAMYARQEAREAEMAIVVEDRWQSRGIGRLLLGRLAEEAGRRGIESFTGTVLGENRDALRFFSSVLPKAKFEIKDGMYNFHFPLANPDPTHNLLPPGGAKIS